MAHHPGTLQRFAAAGVPQPNAAVEILSVTGHVDAGQAGNEALTWVQQVIAAGDEVVIRVVERDACDPPERQPPPNADDVRAGDEQLYRKLGRDLGYTADDEPASSS
jgi:hypothetical protein